MSSPSAPAKRRPVATVLLLALSGLYLLAGGIVLSLLGGSWFYAALGAAFLVQSVLGWRRSGGTLPMAGVTLIVTIVWSLFEVGLDVWGLEVRLLVPAIATAWLLLPPVRASLKDKGRLSTPLAAFSVVAAVLAIALGTVSLTPYRAQETMAGAASSARDAAASDWRAPGGAIGADRFSRLAALTPQNAGGLKQAWVYHTGASTRRGDFEATPLKIGDTLYICSSRGVAALDAVNGRQKWLYVPPPAATKEGAESGGAGTCRGLSYYDGSAQAGACAGRLFEPSNARIIALDPATGKPCSDFGTNGILDTLVGLGAGAAHWVTVSSAPLVIGDRLIVGQSVSDNQFFGEPAGGVRAYDVHSGRLLWAWDVGRDPTNKPLAPGETYTPATPNAWGMITGDAALGLAYVPTGVTTPDYFGGRRRKFDDVISTAVVALDVATGLERWHFQTVHHDLWDMDVPTGPSLVDLALNGVTVPALVQSTKVGELFILDRRTGKPLFPIVEKPVPKGDVAGEYYAPTQPFVSGAQSLRPGDIHETGTWGATLFDQLLCRIDFKRLDYKGPFTPPSLRGALVFPAYFGVTDWSGIAIDPQRQVAIENMSYMPWTARLTVRKDAEAKGWVKPWSGAGKMPPRGFANIRPQYFTPYVVDIEPWLNILGVPCKAPPFGELAAYDLRAGKLLWKQIFGTSRHNAPLGLTENLPLPTGAFSVGGSLVTAGGLTFIAATTDRQIRAFETATGRLVWQAELPVGGHASPMTYRGRDGRQYVAIAAGGNWGMRGAIGDTLVAFALDK